jgi:hypothetical protein
MVSSHHAVRPWFARAPLSVTIISARCCSCLIHSSSGNYKDYFAFGCFHDARRLLWQKPRFHMHDLNSLLSFFFILLFCEIDSNHFFYWMIMNDLESTCACINEIFSYQFIHKLIKEKCKSSCKIRIYRNDNMNQTFLFLVFIIRVN